MHTTAVHQAVEREFGLDVNYRSIKACLSEGVRMKPARFERVSYGCYRNA